MILKLKIGLATRMTSNSESGGELLKNAPDLPLLYHGLDPLTHVFTRLFIRDIQNLKETDVTNTDNGKSGSFLYFDNHLVTRVDLIGSVVMIDSKAIKSSYAIDDGTGVIMCNKWKNTTSQKNVPLQTNLPFLPESLKKKQKEICSVYDVVENDCAIGDVVRIRGRVVLYNSRKEIDVISMIVLDNPCSEINRVLEIPIIYSKFYNLPVCLPDRISQIFSSKNIDGRLANTIRKYLESEAKCIDSFTSRDVLKWPSVVNLLNSEAQSDGAECLNSAGVRKILDDFCNISGLICQVKGDGEKYEIIKSNCRLCNVVADIVRTACCHEKNSEKGCHFLYIVDRLRHCSVYNLVGENVLSKVLNYLECDSEIISVGEKRYFTIT